MTRAALTRMKTLISYRAERARQASKGECSVAERETCLHQTRWISDILGQISMGEFMGVTSSPAITGVDTGDAVTFKRPNKVRPTPELQGPVLWQPAPEVPDDIFPEANDIAVLESDGVGVIVITWQGGRVDVGIVIDGVEGVWAVKGVSREELANVRVAAYESIHVSVSRDAWTRILTSLNDSEGVFVAAEGGVWQIDFRSWLQELQKMSQQDSDDGEHEPFEAKSSITTLISQTYPHSPSRKVD